VCSVHVERVIWAQEPSGVDRVTAVGGLVVSMPV
jgi:hypothetical protein